ncbi:MAG TPA: hypothetical protein VFE46_07540 [Pirellulales bacterium]|nr:hypothetical protein [Pirellulales bacterium]
MVQFSLQRLLVSVALIALGLAVLMSPLGRFYFAHPTYPAELSLDRMNFWLIAWMTAGLWIGAGLGLPWRYPIRGACLGIMTQFIVWAALAHWR